MSLTGDLKLKMCRKVVAAAGTEEALVAGSRSAWRCIAIRIRAYTTNTGNIYVGSQAGLISSTDYSDILEPGEVWEARVGDYDRKMGAFLNMTEIWLDADVNGDGVSYTALMEMEPA